MIRAEIENTLEAVGNFFLMLIANLFEKHFQKREKKKIIKW